jgi:hypothetical protein
VIVVSLIRDINGDFLAIFVSDAVGIAIWVPWLTSTFSHSEDDSGRIDGGIDFYGGSEVARITIEFVPHDLTLSELNVGSGESLDFFCLKLPIRIVETFRSVASRGRKILVGFVLPVGPAEKVFLSNISDLVDFAGTDIGV